MAFLTFAIAKAGAPPIMPNNVLKLKFTCNFPQFCYVGAEDREQCKRDKYKFKSPLPPDWLIIKYVVCFEPICASLSVFLFMSVTGPKFLLINACLSE